MPFTPTAPRGSPGFSDGVGNEVEAVVVADYSAGIEALKVKLLIVQLSRWLRVGLDKHLGESCRGREGAGEGMEMKKGGGGKQGWREGEHKKRASGAITLNRLDGEGGEGGRLWRGGSRNKPTHEY